MCDHVSVLQVSLLINEVICAFLLDVVSMSEQPDDFIAGK